MKAIEEAADLAADVIPAARGARWVAYLIVAVIAAGLIGVAFWWFFIHPQQLARQAGQARADATLGKASGDIAIGAIPEITGATRQKVEVDVHVTKDQADVRAAPDAGVEIRGVSDAVRRAVCLYDNATDCPAEPVHADPAGVRPARSNPASVSPAD